jgi:glycerol-3-phosphate acyltransferase PlsY
MNASYLLPIAAFLIGSVPFGYLIVKLTQGTDIRHVGSGNIGATNVFRKNRWAGLATLALDAGKGYAAVMLAQAVGAHPGWQAVAAAAAIAGHVFTPWLRFRGGKGVATGAGAYLALAPAALGAALVLFVLVAVSTRYVSLASIAATAAFPVLAYATGRPVEVLAASIVGSVLIIARHHENVRRLLAGTENKFAFGDRA